MLKRYVILRRKPGMSTEDFRNYWQNVHGPLITKIPGIVKYFQYHVHSEETNGADDPIDGIAEFWFSSEQEMQKALKTPEYLAMLKDEVNFIEMNSHYRHSVITDKIVEIV